MVVKTGVIHVGFIVCTASLLIMSFELSFFPQSVGAVHLSKERTSSYANETQQLWMVSIPGLSFLDLTPSILQHYPHLQKLFQSGRIAAMNVRTPERGVEDSYLTLGAGHASVARSEEGFYTQNEQLPDQTYAQDLYTLYTGNQPMGTIMTPYIESIKRLQMHSSYESHPGALGEALLAGNVDIYVYGNRDRGTSENAPKLRHLPLMLMNEKGTIEKGIIGNDVLIPNQNMPYHVETDYDLLLQAVKQPMGDHKRLIAMELGDYDRLLSIRNFISPQRFEQIKHQIFLGIDRFIGQIMQEMTDATSLCLFSPLAKGDAIQAKYMLPPMIMYDLTDQKSGVLYSETTRRYGVISNYDVAPTILEEFGIVSSENWIGRPVQVRNQEDSMEFLQKELKGIADVYQLRPHILIPFVTYEVIVMVGCLLVLWKGWGGYYRLRSFLLFSLLTAPFSLLVTGYAYTLGSYAMLAIFLLLCVGCSLWLARLTLSKALWSISAVTSTSILIDGLLGGRGMKHSVLGYDPIIGARYYGIGNELMGVLIGAVVLLFSTHVQMQQSKGNVQSSKTGKILGALLLFAVLIYFASPQLGTNAGGAITAFITFTLLWMRSFYEGWKERLRAGKLLLGIFFGGCFGLLLLWIVNHFFPFSEQQSHIGKAMQKLMEGDAIFITHLMERKIKMNLHLLGVSVWSKVLIASVVVVTLLLLRPKGMFHRWQSRYPFYMVGFTATSVGSFVAFLVNDSGIVAAATMIVYAAVPMLLLRTYEQRFSHFS